MSQINISPNVFGLFVQTQTPDVRYPMGYISVDCVL